MGRARFWLVVPILFWLLIGIGAAADDRRDYRELVEQAGAGEIGQPGVGIALAVVAFVALVQLIFSKERTRGGAAAAGLTFVLFGLFGLLQVMAAEQARCPSIGFGAQQCADIKSSYVQFGWLLFAIACASVVLLLIVLRVAGTRPSPASADGRADADIAGQIRELAALRDDGILTEEEFQSRKQRLLDQDP